MTTKSKSYSSIIFWLFILLIFYFPLFLHLDYLPLFNYDEARLASSALLMIENQQYWIPYFGDQPDHWNTKPPLMIWAQVLSMKIFGYNELAVRLPAALCGLFTLGFLIAFCKKYLSSRLLGIIIAMVLLTSAGYIQTHVTRTGDYDAMLVLWSTMAVLSFFLFLNSAESQAKFKYLVASSMFSFLAIMTKSVAGLLFLPGLFIWVIMERKTKWLFVQWKFWVCVLSVIALVVSYYGFREMIDPGYLHAVWDNEVVNRYIDPADEHRRAATFQLFQKFWKHNFQPWFYLLPLVFFFFVQLDKRKRSLVKLATIMTVSYFVVLAFSATQLEWYDAPIYPYAAIMVGMGIYAVWEFLIKKQYASNWAIGIFMLLLFAAPYHKTIQSVYFLDYKLLFNWESNQYGQYMKRIHAHKEYTLLTNDDYYSSHTFFYQQAYNTGGYTIGLKSPISCEVNQKVVVCEEDVRAKIKTLYEFEILDEHRPCQLLYLKKKKEND